MIGKPVKTLSFTTQVQELKEMKKLIKMLNLGSQKEMLLNKESLISSLTNLDPQNQLKKQVMKFNKLN